MFVSEARQHWRQIIVGLCIGFLVAGCETTGNDLEGVDSVTSAGVTSYRKDPVIGDKDDVYLGDKVHIVAGKEYDSFGLDLDISCKNGEVATLKVNASGVKAFDGQASAAAAVVAIRESLSERDREIFDGISGAIESLLGTYLNTIAPSICAAR